MQDSVTTWVITVQSMNFSETKVKHCQDLVAICSDADTSERYIIDESSNAHSLTCSAHPGLQARIVQQTDDMSSEFPATPPPLSRRASVRTDIIRCRAFCKT